MKQDEIKIGERYILYGALDEWDIPMDLLGREATVIHVNPEYGVAIAHCDDGRKWCLPLDMVHPIPQTDEPKPEQPPAPEPTSPPCYSCGSTDAHTERCGPTHEAQDWMMRRRLPPWPRPSLVACPCGRRRVRILSVPGEEGISEALWTCLYCAGAR